LNAQKKRRRETGKERDRERERQGKRETGKERDRERERQGKRETGKKYACNANVKKNKK
jgi:hypothetical protein